MAVHIIRPTIRLRTIIARCFDISVSRYAISRCSLITRSTRRTRMNWNTLEKRTERERKRAGERERKRENGGAIDREAHVS